MEDPERTVQVRIKDNQECLLPKESSEMALLYAE